MQYHSVFSFPRAQSLGAAGPATNEARRGVDAAANNSEEDVVLHGGIAQAEGLSAATHGAPSDHIEPCLEVQAGLHAGSARSTEGGGTLLDRGLDDQPPPLSFDTIREVAEIARRLAIQHYRDCVMTVAMIEEPLNRADAVEALRRAESQARKADAALLAVMAAEDSNRASVVELCVERAPMAGHAACHAANAHALESSRHLRSAADHLSEFGGAVAATPAYEPALRMVRHLDRVGKVMSAGVDLGVDAFGRALKAFAARVRGFSEVLASKPVAIVSMARRSGLAVAEVARRSFEQLQGRYGRIQGELQRQAQDLRVAAWQALDQSAFRMIQAQRAVAEGTSVVLQEGRVHADMSVRLVARAASSFQRSAGGVARAADDSLRALGKGYAQARAESASRLGVHAATGHVAVPGVDEGPRVDVGEVIRQLRDSHRPAVDRPVA